MHVFVQAGAEAVDESDCAMIRRKMRSTMSEWELGFRVERLSATHRLNGPGASLLASETQLSAYAPSSRHTLMLGYSPSDWADIHMEAGRESVGGARVSFATLRLVLKYATKPFSVR